MYVFLHAFCFIPRLNKNNHKLQRDYPVFDNRVAKRPPRKNYREKFVLAVTQTASQPLKMFRLDVLDAPSVTKNFGNFIGKERDIHELQWRAYTLREKCRMKRLVTIKMAGPIPDTRDFCEEQHSLIYRRRFYK